MRVLVSGAAGGIGRETVLRLREQHEVIALDRDERVEAIRGVDARVVDATDARAVRETIAPIDLDAVVTCVGSYELGALEDQPPAAFANQFETNVLGTHTVVHAALPSLRERAGRVAIVGSLLGRVALPYHGPYAASKHALVGYADALRREHARVSVSLIEPGPVATGLNERARAALDSEGSAHGEAYRTLLDHPSRSATTPEAVAGVIVEALTAERPRHCYRVSLRARLLPWLRALLPTRLFDRIVRSGTTGLLSQPIG
ncbi:MAG: SDR family NAD(P)-dependent oxidoreductase [Halalkalicoccus sp.]